MAKTQFEVITSVDVGGVEFRREETAGHGIVGAGPSQLYKWRRQLCARQGAASRFMPVQIVGGTATPGLPARVGVIEIEPGGTRLRITGAAAAQAVRPILRRFDYLFLWRVFTSKVDHPGSTVSYPGACGGVPTHSALVTGRP
jgi:hypothetical protein